VGSSRRARRRRRHARWGKPVYPPKPQTRGLRRDLVIYDEVSLLAGDEWPMVIDPGAFAGCDGKVVPVSVGGVGGPVAGRGTVRAAADGVVVDVEMDGPRVPVRGGMSFSFVQPDVRCFMCGEREGLLLTVPPVCGDTAACAERMAPGRVETPRR
jgi:hypothetical protein